MIIILNDELVYASWIRRHRDGFVLDTRRRATKRNTMLHRASCGLVKKSRTKKTHWTTGAHVKACSANRDELIAWATEQIGAEPRCCVACQPESDAQRQIQASSGPLTRLEKEVLSSVLESAVLHLDNEIEFRLTVADVAEYLSKTPPQISAALHRLVADGLLESDPQLGNGQVESHQQLYPTERSLRTVPAFAALGTGDLRQELASLHS